MEPQEIAPIPARLDAPRIPRESRPLTRVALPVPPEPRTNVDRNELDARVAAANTELAALNQDLRFSIHDKSGEMIVEVVDTKTGEVLREQPPQEFLDLVVRLREMVGLFLDAKS
jgi:uncharacterized FlaG/YvyC family protein